MSRLNGRRAEAEAQGLRVNVAILGAGRIAHSMARTLVAMAADPRYAGLVAPYAVAARDGGRAAAFAAEYGFPVSYGSYDELLADPDVDLVYIATPHSLHAEQGIACLKAGKNILVEKSFTANAAQARALLDAADGCRRGPSSTGSWPPARSASCGRFRRTCAIRCRARRV